MLEDLPLLMMIAVWMTVVALSIFVPLRALRDCACNFLYPAKWLACSLGILVGAMVTVYAAIAILPPDLGAITDFVLTCLTVFYFSAPIVLILLTIAATAIVWRRMGVTGGLVTLTAGVVVSPVIWFGLTLLPLVLLGVDNLD